MKYLVYWLMYLSTDNAAPKNLAGVLSVDTEKNTVTTYIDGLGYLPFDIKYSKITVDVKEHKYIERAVILAEKKGIRITITVSKYKITEEVQIPEYNFHEVITKPIKQLNTRTKRS